MNSFRAIQPVNPFVFILLLITFVGSEVVGFEIAEDWSTRILAVLLTAAMVPAVALFQAGVLVRRFKTEDEPLLQRRSSCQRMLVAHSVVWLTASGAIVWALRWQDVVLGNWKLDRWPLLGELTILAPSIVAMCLSWLVYYELNRAMQVGLQAGNEQFRKGQNDGESQERPNQFFRRLKLFGNEISARWQFVTFRFRIFFLPLMVSALIVWSAKSGYFSSLNPTIEISPAAAVGVLLIFAWAFPFVLLVVWKNRAVQDPVLARQLQQINNKSRLRVCGFREWQTNRQCANAGVVGFFPFARFVFLSDLLIEQFPSREIAAVVRHEAGHIIRKHAFLRTVMLAIPMLVWLIYFGHFANQPGIRNASPAFCSLVTVLFLFLGGLCNRWIAHQTEWDADLFAISDFKKTVLTGEAQNSTRGESGNAPSTRNPSPNDDSVRKFVCLEKSAEMIDALYRLAAYSDLEFRQATFFHPSTLSRIDFIKRVGENPNLFQDFRRQFWWSLLAIWLGWAIVAALGFWLQYG